MGELTHTDRSGRARMVDVGGKAVTRREATASAVVQLGAEAFRLVRANANAKGDVLAAARIAGIQAAKRTGELIPLCHPLGLDHVEIDLELDRDRHEVRILATARTSARTGVEMEAMTAAAVAALTVYDMCKAADRGIVVRALRLETKSGGKSGPWRRDEGSRGESDADPR